MKHLSSAAMFALLLLLAAPGLAQTNAQRNAAPSSGTEADDNDVQVDISALDFLLDDVRQEKAEIMDGVMMLSADDAAKFWPIYGAYDSQLKKLNDRRVEDIQDYARSYDRMTDEKADELVQKGMTYQKQRTELLAEAYDQVKQALGAATAARFAQVESHSLLIIDLQVDSALPLIGASSKGRGPKETPVPQRSIDQVFEQARGTRKKQLTSARAGQKS
jgi:hypothetical protein